MTTQQLYQKVLNEQMTKVDFLWNVRRDENLSSFITNTMSYDDTVNVLKSKGYVWGNSEQLSAVKAFDFIGAMKSLNEAAKKTNKVKGGKGDKLSPDQVNYHEFTKGWKHELEHTDDIDVAKEIALDHLAEDPNYYTRLDMVEYQAKKEKKKEKPQEPKDSLKDKDNQMVSPKGIEKFKKNVGNKKEKAKKITGVKTMKGGTEAPKVIKEDLGGNLKYDPDQKYMYKKFGKEARAEKMSLSAFNRLMADSDVTDFEKYDEEGFKKLQSKKDVSNRYSDKSGDFSVKTPEDTDFSYYEIMKGPGAGAKNPVRMTKAQADKWIAKLGPDSLKKVSAPSSLRYTSLTPGKATASTSTNLYTKKDDTKKDSVGVKQVTQTPFTRAPFYVINKDAKTKDELDAKGYKDKESAKKAAADKGGSYIAIQGLALSGYENKLQEDLDKDTKANIEANKVSFVIPGDTNPDEKQNVSDTVSSAKYDKAKNELKIQLAGGSELVFTPDPAGQPVGVYFTNVGGQRKSYKLLDVLAPLNAAIDKVFAQKKTDTVNESLENYIRRRIKEALSIKEDQYTDSGAYNGYIGKDVVKKKLNDYMKRYSWNYQNSEDPAVRDRGQEVHGIVSKMVHALGDEGVEIFNDYAPKGYEIKSKDDLNKDQSFVVGMGPQDRAFYPNQNASRNFDSRSQAAVGNGGRIAENDLEKSNVDKLLSADLNRLSPLDANEMGEKLMTYMLNNGGLKDSRNKKYYDKFLALSNKFKK
jgi:hypothetical protein